MEAIVINKSPIDSREYSYKILSNSLKLVLISDPECTKAAVSITVAAGSMHDPYDLLGLAHFCEHMLFMGTKSHPAENAFDEFLSKNGGSTNAMTEQCFTHFYFDCTASALNEALELFTSFFIEPLFSESGVSREVQAIDSEFSSIKKSDNDRLHYLIISYLNKKNPINKEGYGTKETLCGPKLRDKVEEFFNKNYSANMMTCVVYSSGKIDEIYKTAKTFLEKIPNKHIDNIEKQLSIYPAVYEENHYGRIFKVVPTKVKRRIVVNWFLPYYGREFKIKPYSYILDLIGHEGPNSLLSYLKKKQLATAVITDCLNEYPSYMNLSVIVKLTSKGESDWETVLEAIFAYIKIAANADLQKYQYILDEIAFMSNLSFAYKAKSHSIDYAQEISHAMHCYPPENLLDNHYLNSTSCYDDIKKFNNYLQASKCDIILLTKRAKSLANLTHKPWGTRYCVQKIPEGLMRKLENPIIPAELGLPPKNDFIPYDALSVGKGLIFKESMTEPQLIRLTEFSELWYMYDSSFKIPKTIITMKLYCGDCGFGNTMEGEIFAALYGEIVIDILSEFLYMGRLANISVVIDFSSKEKCGTFKITAYSFGLVPFLTQLFTKLSQIDIRNHKSEFNKQHEKYLKSLQSFAMSSPDEQMFSHFKSILYTNFYLPEQLIPIAESFTFEKFSNMYAKWLKNLHYTMYIHGTIPESESHEIVKIIDNILFKNITPLQIKDRPDLTMLKIPEKTTYAFIKAAQEEDEENSTVAVFFEGEPKQTLKEIAEMYIFHMYIKERAFNVLRTQEQLGYNVDAVGFTGFDTLAIAFIVESNRFCPEMIITRIDEFIKQLLKEFSELKISDFNGYRESAKTEFLEKETKMKEKARKMGREIFKSEFLYDRKAKMLEELEKTTQENVFKLANNILAVNKKRLELEIVCADKMKENEEMYKQNTKKVKNEINRVRIDNIDDFKSKIASFYQDFNKERYLEFLEKAPTLLKKY